MNNQIKKLQVTHVNIRLSISFLLLKLFLVEMMTGTLVILFHTLLVSGVLTRFNTDISLLTIPVIISFVIIKSAIIALLFLQWLNEYYEITPHLVAHRRGLIFRHVEKYPLKDIRDIEVDQTLFGRLFNYGTISLSDPTHHIKYLDMYQIHNPLRYATVLEDVIPNKVEKINIIREHIIEPERKFVWNNG